ncbi:hypothetical protein MJH12_14280 [bacterium]|nr:hypothetical protein [bacterium]
MFFCFVLACFLSTTTWLNAASIPDTFHYQGRFLDRDTNRPVEGVVTKQIRFNIRRVNADQTLGSILRGMTKQVSVIDGVFSADLDFSGLPFDEPYAIQVIVQGSGGGDVGTQKFRTVPYSFTSRDALQLGGITSDGYAKKTHSHETSGTKSFTIDGSGATLSANDTQFEIISGATNSQGSVVFRVNASGDLDQVNSIKVKKNIEVEGRLVVRNELGVEVFVADSTTGNVKIAGNLDVAQDSIVGSLTVSSASTLQQVNIMGDLTFGPDARINLPTDSGLSVIGQSHALEHHKSSDLLTKLNALVSGGTLDSSIYHSHSFNPGSITSDTIVDGAVLSKHILDGTIVNADISDSAAISDTKLATIVSPSKITTSALCDINGNCPIPFKNESNTFGAGFLNTTAQGRVDTINYFDAMQSKQMTVIATNSLTKNFIRFTDSNKSFFWDIDGDGTLSYSTKVDENNYNTKIKISPSGTETKISLKNIVFDGNSQLITGAVIKDGTITTDDLADNSITSAKIADGAISTAKIEAGAITPDKIADEAIDSSKIKDGSIDSSDIMAGAVTTIKIQDASITSDLIATNAIDTTNIKDGAITASKISNSSITSTQIATETITTLDIGDLQVTAEKIKDGEITNFHLLSTVVKSRIEAMSISINDTTTEPNLTLSRTNSGTFLKMVDQTANALSTPALLFEDNAGTEAAKKSVSLNVNGSLSLKSDKFLTPVTLTAELFGVMFGRDKSTNESCPFGNGYSLVAPGGSSPQGTGFCTKKYDAATKDYRGAMVQCSGEGARICSTNELLKACADNVYSNNVTDFMTSDLIENGGLRYVTVTLVGSSTCASSVNFLLADALTSTTNEFFCCINP